MTSVESQGAPNGAYMTVTFDNGNQQIAWNPAVNGDPVVREQIESMRAWFATNGFTDIVPWMELGWFALTLPEDMTAPISSLYQIFTDWPGIYAALNLDPPTT